MKEHPAEGNPEESFRDFAVEVKVTVLIVANQRVTAFRGVHTDLMRAAGEEFHVEETHVAIAADERKDRVRGDAFSGSTRTRRSPSFVTYLKSGSFTCCRSFTQSPFTSVR